jgi:transketolase N-terminal domain/subunit
MSSGSLGQGLSVGIGVALAKKLWQKEDSSS